MDYLRTKHNHRSDDEVGDHHNGCRAFVVVIVDFLNQAGLGEKNPASYGAEKQHENDSSDKPPAEV